MMYHLINWIKILEAARLSLTANNKQFFRLYVIKTDGLKEELKNIFKQE